MDDLSLHVEGIEHIRFPLSTYSTWHGSGRGRQSGRRLVGRRPANAISGPAGMSVAARTIKYMSDDQLIDNDTLNVDSIPLERLEARICELAGHLTAATCRFLELVADFDNREGWASWELPSCAAWLSWKCQIAPGTAREHVRVARALPGLPLIRAEFAAARLSYAKVRALTRIATADNEEDLAPMAIAMTAGQLERFARAHRRVTDADGARSRSRRQLALGMGRRPRVLLPRPAPARAGRRRAAGAPGRHGRPRAPPR